MEIQEKRLWQVINLQCISLDEITGNRKSRFRSYAELQKEHIQIRYTDYKQVYRSWMRYDETPDNIRNRLAKQLPKNFSGHATKHRGCTDFR